MTQPKALEVLQKSSLVNSSTLSKVTGLLTGSQNLRKQLSAADGFGGLDGARRLLNGMIHEVMEKYDEEIAKCTDYYAKQCASILVFCYRHDRVSLLCFCMNAVAVIMFCITQTRCLNTGPEHPFKALIQTHFL